MKAGQDFAGGSDRLGRHGPAANRKAAWFQWHQSHCGRHAEAILSNRPDREFIMKISRLGNSLTVSIPDDVAEALGLQEGDDVELRPGEDGSLIVKRSMSREEAIEGLRAFRGRLPADFRFDREEANAR